MRKYCSTFILLVAACLVMGCGDKEGDVQPKTPAGTAAGQFPTLTIGHVGHDHQIALGVAAMKPDYMKKECGVYLKEMKPREVYHLMKGGKTLAEFLVKKVGGGSRMPSAMSEGKIDIGFGGIPAVIFSVDQGNKAKILCPLNVDGDMLLVRNDFPAKTWDEFVKAVKNSPETVKIGYKAPVAVAKLIFVKGCEAAGVVCAAAGEAKAGQVELVNMQGAGNVIPSLDGGAVHGAVINEPIGSMAVHKGTARIVCLLSELPPEGMWQSHPCCCVCATEDSINKHPKVLEHLIKMMKAGTDWINANKKEASKVASEWTKKEIEVETMSVPNIVYTSQPGEAYRTGLFRWFDMMTELDKFTGSLKGLSKDKAFAKVHDLSFIK